MSEDIVEKWKKYLNEGRSYDYQQLADLIENEGFGYAIQNYLSWKDIEDKQIAKQWKIAADAMNKIEKILGPYMH